MYYTVCNIILQQDAEYSLINADNDNNELKEHLLDCVFFSLVILSIDTGDSW
jgi:hypothetical protein